MKGCIKAMAATAFIAVLSLSSASAADVGGISLGVKAGNAIVSAFDDVPGVNSKEDTAFGFNLAYTFAPNWSAEFEFVTGSTEVTGTLRSLVVDIESMALYAAYRSQDQLYFVGKIGVAQVELSGEIIGSTKESGTSFGGGLGYRLMPNLGVEVDYTVVEEDTDWLMLSLRYDL